MIKIFKPGKVVILLNGRHAGKKAVVIKISDFGHMIRPYGHAFVIGISKIPKMLIRRHSYRQLKKARTKTFIQMVNFKHLMPTRYNIQIEDMKSLITSDSLETSNKKVKINKCSKTIFEDKFKKGKVSWFFNKLRF